MQSSLDANNLGRGRVMTLAGLAALACYATHAAFHLAHGRWYDLFWACHVAAILVGVGLLARSAATNGVGVLLGLMGLPLWLADLAAGGPFFPTSLLTHVVALAIGLYGVLRLGMPRGTWWKAAATLAALIGFCRIATPAGPNVNVAFDIQPGWEEHFASHASYLAFTLTAATAYFFVVEKLVRFLAARFRGNPQSLTGG
jgi:hypothetical protein